LIKAILMNKGKQSAEQLLSAERWRTRERTDQHNIKTEIRCVFDPPGRENKVFEGESYEEIKIIIKAASDSETLK